MHRAFAGLVAVMWAVVLLGGAFRPQASAAAAGSEPRAQAGYLAPPFSAPGLTGQTVSLDSYRGQAVFLNFWASWCAPCRLEMPEIERLAAGLPPGTAIVTVTQESQAEPVIRFLQQSGYHFPTLLDATGEISQTYRVVSLPTSLFISPEGVVTARISGPLSHAAMVDYLKAAGR